MSRETDLAWAAGIVDGEGCIGLHTVKSTKGNTCYVLRLTITNTNMLLLNRVIEIFGFGKLIAKKRQQPHHKTQWHWQVCSKQAQTALEILEPYLVNKREEARLALYSRKLMQRHGRNQENPNTEELAWLKRQLSELK